MCPTYQIRNADRERERVRELAALFLSSGCGTEVQTQVKMSNQRPTDSRSDPNDQDQMMEYFKQQILFLQEKAMLQASVREEKKLLVENAKLKKDIDDLKKHLQETQKRKAAKLHQERVLTDSIASKASLLQETTPTSSTHTCQEGRRRRERRGQESVVLKGSECSGVLMREQKPDISRLDLRVGRILAVRKHPDSETLYIQEVELGEHAPRIVVSGLTNHVLPEELLGRLAVLVCNVRPVKLRGVQSQARLLCAVSQEKMEPLTPPTGAQPGDRVTFQNYPGKPEKELNPKHRIWERLLPDMCTDAKGVATYKGVAFEVRGKGLCRAPGISNGGIK